MSTTVEMFKEPTPTNAKPARSLEGLHATVPVPPASAGFWRQLRAFAGPAFLVSVGYMDPGNWATDLKGGALYRYDLLWVVAAASLMAIVMQVIAARLGIVTGKDLAQACRDYYPAWTRWPNWIFCEIAIAACDLAEVVGSAVAIHLLFPAIPMHWAVVITAFDVLLLLALQGFGMRFIEAIVFVLVATIGVCYFVEIFILPPTRPDFLEMGRAMLRPTLGDKEMIVIAVGIIGATVMPHNLYLHSALVQSRRLHPDEAGVKRAIRFNTIDTVLALSIAFLVNAAILVLAAIVFNQSSGAFDENTDWITVGYQTLSSLEQVAGLGDMIPTGTAACTLFAIALLASGQSSTITGTLAGQVVMEGFMHWRIQPWLRRTITRSLAVLPAVAVTWLRPEAKATDLLVLSQVVLAMQLPFAMFPLLHFAGSRKWMGDHRIGWFLLIAGWASAFLITALDIFSLPQACEEAWEVIAGTTG